jgi:purine-binding chemotaxis protein CheW
MSMKTANERFLTFSLGQEEYAVPLLRVKEVMAVTETTPVPYTPSHFLGIMNLRGQVISVIDLRLKFKMKKAETTSETAIIIADLAPISLGVVVDSINSVLSLSPDEIRPRPQIESNPGSDYILGVAAKDSRLILLLDLIKALSMDDQAAIQQQAHAGRKTA